MSPKHQVRLSGEASEQSNMSESEVKNVVNDAIKEYDKETALPRHTQVMSELQTMRDGQNQLIGAATFAKWILAVSGVFIGIPGSIWMVVQIIRALR